MPEEEKNKLGLSFVQVATAVLTTLTVTVASSYLGTAGTLIGAIAGSILSTVGAAFHSYWLRGAGTRIKTLHQKQLSLSPVILASGAARLLIATLGGVYAVEAATGHPVSALVRGNTHETGTTFGHLVSSNTNTAANTNITPTPSESATVTPSLVPTTETPSAPVVTPTPTVSASDTPTDTPTPITSDEPTPATTPSAPSPVSS